MAMARQVVRRGQEVALITHFKSMDLGCDISLICYLSYSRDKESSDRVMCMDYHLKAYGFLFTSKGAVRSLELLPCCHGNMHSGVFRHISSRYPIEALLYLSTKDNTFLYFMI